jgi:membrane-associated phospholipid phosphatase
LNYLTDLADQAVMLPVAALIALGLAVSRWWRGLGAWVFAVVGMLGTMAVLKYVFYTCVPLWQDTGIRSPSGHTAASATIYGGVLVLLLRDRLRPALLALIPVTIAVLFAITRLVLHAHDVAEVVAGGAVGLVSVTVLVLLAGPRPAALPVWPVAVLATGSILWFHGVRLPAEAAIHNFALFTWLPLPAVCRA